MKTKELIAQLQKEDPEGENEVCVDNKPIYFAESKPAYWDGPLEVLVQNHSLKCYNVVGARITTKGTKIELHVLSIEDALVSQLDLPVEIDVTYCDPKPKLELERRVRKWRLDNLRVLVKVQKWMRSMKPESHSKEEWDSKVAREQIEIDKGKAFLAGTRVPGTPPTATTEG